jgi:hypothetical protein
MANYNFGSVNIDGGKSSVSTHLFPVRVMDVILNSDHEEYDRFGKALSIGVIKYIDVSTPLTEEIEDLDITDLPGAYPLNANIRQLPLKNEIVLLTSAPSVDSSNNRTVSEQTYYTSIAAVWNHPTHNASVNQHYEDKTTGDFPDKSDTVAPLQPFSGDVILEGRLGQSLRLSGASNIDNIYTDSDNNGKPFTILRNGQKPGGDGQKHTVEDVNKDDSSIYLTSDHLVPLEEVRSKYLSYFAGKEPTVANQYKGKQIILNSGRLFFNAKDEGIYFAAQRDFGISAESVHIEGVSTISIDAKKIHLGTKALELEVEPVIKGDQLEMLLFTLLNELKQVAKAMKKAKTVKGDAVPSLIQEGFVLEKIVKNLSKRINPGGPSELKSKKVYTE